jgi:hypothetical protein
MPGITQELTAREDLRIFKGNSPIEVLDSLNLRFYTFTSRLDDCTEVIPSHFAMGFFVVAKRILGMTKSREVLISYIKIPGLSISKTMMRSSDISLARFWAWQSPIVKK